MKIYLTLDYEIYFGKNHGSVFNCIIYPTAELIKIAEKHNVRFTFFVDIGFVIKLEEYSKTFSQLEKDYLSITSQIKYLSESGHDIQLHIHPHWEDSFFDGKNWVINTSRYKLTDFTENEIEQIVPRYKNALVKITNKKTIAYRAGGWCIQPFKKLKNVFIENGISIDSSVFRNGYFESKEYSYDFRNSPDKDIYKFENDVIVENSKGVFTELPISSIHNSPLFFWKLFLLGRWNSYLHKPIGDGQPMPATGYRKKLLTEFTNNPVSIDGYNVSLLTKALSNLKAKGFEHMVIIGHPKALSRFSIKTLDEFIDRNKEKNNFTTFSKEF